MASTDRDPPDVRGRTRLPTSAVWTGLALLAALPAWAAAPSASTEGSTPSGAATGPSVTTVIVDAIDRGVPLFNSGDHEGCARAYAEAAQELLSRQGATLSRLNRYELETALAQPAPDAASRAWSLRDAFDRILDHERFEPLVEAPLPEGFPSPGPLGHVVVKQYPKYRAARADGRDAFGTLFRHIQENDVRMTTPVETTLTDGMRETDMAFLYEAPEQGAAGKEGRVEVLDLEPTTVVSVGLRGRRSADAVEVARGWILEHMNRDGWCQDGPWRTLGYNSPRVGASRSYWELQVPVTRCR